MANANLHSGPAHPHLLPGALIPAVTVNVLLAVAPLAVVVAPHLQDVAVVVISLLARMIAVTETTIVEIVVIARAAQTIGQLPNSPFRTHKLTRTGTVISSVRMTVRIVRMAPMETIGKVTLHFLNDFAQQCPLILARQLPWILHLLHMMSWTPLSKQAIITLSRGVRSVETKRQFMPLGGC